VSIAITIATSDDKGIQRALQDAYERNDLRGKSLLRARRLIENRRTRGKKSRAGSRSQHDRPVSTELLLKTFQQETVRQKMIIQKAKICETRLLFAVSALKQLFQDDHFVTLLRAEGLDSLPQYLADQIYQSRETP
jgi:ParB family chromosome partitioning protein